MLCVSAIEYVTAQYMVVCGCVLKLQNISQRVLRQQKKTTRATMEAQESAFWFSQKPPVSYSWRYSVRNCCVCL